MADDPRVEHMWNVVVKGNGKGPLTDRVQALEDAREEDVRNTEKGLKRRDVLLAIIGLLLTAVSVYHEFKPAQDTTKLEQQIQQLTHEIHEQRR